MTSASGFSNVTEKNKSYLEHAILLTIVMEQWPKCTMNLKIYVHSDINLFLKILSIKEWSILMAQPGDPSLF